MNHESEPGGNEGRESVADLLRRTKAVVRGIAEAENLSPSLTRRQVLTRIGYGTVGLAAVGGGIALLHDNQERYEEKEAEFERSDDFYSEVRGYEAQVKLRFDEVLFVDETGAPIAVVKLEDMVIDREGESYLLSPGTLNEYGILEDGISGEWLDHVRVLLKENHFTEIVDQEEDIPRALSVRSQFIHALQDATEPELAQMIKAGEVTTYEEILRYFAEKPVVLAPEFTRSEYVLTHMQFSPDVHPAAQGELRHLIVGLCAQESNFHNGLVSASNARGIFQILEEVWVEDYDRDVKEFDSLRAQVEVAGKHVSRMYNRMQEKAGELAMQQLRVLHPDEDMLQAEVLVPLTLNSYNAGPDRVGEAVRRYFETPENREKQLIGRDLFLDIAQFALESNEGLLSRYGQHAREYVPRIYAKAAVLNEVT